MYAQSPTSSFPSPTGTAQRGNKPGLIGVLLALGAKVVKAAKVAKLALLGASFGIYSVLFSWQFALLILVSLFVHESGHIWAMKRCGMRTKGIYFIPFLGGAAVADEAFPTRRAEAFVAIMGPIWGFALAALVAGVYLVTGVPFWAAAAGWMAFINLFNLFPVNPLDGGRIVKSAAFSLDSRIGIGVMAAGFLAALLVAVQFGFGLLIFIVLIGGAEFAAEVSARKRGGFSRPAMRLPEVVGSLGGYLILGAALLALMTAMQSEPGAGLALQILRS
ncbi:MAG: hypothetical protein PVSMB7_15750 [Chloroflexota bacterium]